MRLHRLVFRACAFVLPAAAVGCGVASTPAGGENMLAHRRSSATPPADVRHLYTAYGSGYGKPYVYTFTLPIETGESGSKEVPADAPAAMALGGGNFYVSGSKAIAEYALPLNAYETPKARVALTNAWGLAYGAGFVYASDHNANSVSSFAAPFTTGERSSATVKAVQPIGLAVNSTMLFVANACSSKCNPLDPIGSVAAYRLPLKTGEAPALKLTDLKSPAGVAVNAKDAFVALRLSGEIAVYPLPLRRNEQPASTLSIQNGQGSPYALALDSANLYVSDDSANVWVYALPIVAGEQPSATLSGFGSSSLALDP